MEAINSFINPILELVPKLPEAILSLVVGYIVIKIVLSILRRLLKIIKFPADLKGVVISVTKVALWILLVVFVASSLGFDKLALAISSSALVLVFLLNNSAGPLIADLVAGFLLVGDPDFTVGMKVVVNEGKTEGTVVGIDMRKVRIKDKDDKIHVVPTSMIEKGEWVVLERKAPKNKTQ